MTKTTKKFGDDVDKFCDRVIFVADRVIKKSIEDVTSEAQKVRGRGGNMRVKTGFLRASIQGSIGEVPSGPARPDKGVNYKNKKKLDGMSVAEALARWDSFGGKKFYVGWTANYAIYRETQDAFMRTAISQWRIIVDKNAKTAKRFL